jgi:hypothetical protein
MVNLYEWMEERFVSSLETLELIHKEVCVVLEISKVLVPRYQFLRLKR